MLKGGFIAPNQVEQTSAQSSAEQSRVLETKARSLAASLEVHDCALKAPFDGEIAVRSVDPGAFVHPGATIVSVVDRNTVRIVVDAPEKDFNVATVGAPVRIDVLATGATLSAAVTRRAPKADPATRTIHFEIDVADPHRQIPTGTTAMVHMNVGKPVPATRIPLDAATQEEGKAKIFVVENDVAHLRQLSLLGERGDGLYFDPRTLPANTQIVTEGRALLSDGDSVAPHVEAARPPAENDGGTRRRWLRKAAVTHLSLRNPLASLMLGIGALIFAWVVTPRMPIDTFPDLTPPVLVVGTLAPGLAAKDVEKTLTWRIEKYVSATPGVEHVQSESRNNLSIAYVWMDWGTDLNAAQTLVQQQVQFAMSAVPKSLGVIPPFVLQFDPTNAPVVQVTVSGGGLSGPQLYDYALNNIEPLLEGIPGVASASPNGGRQRQINVIVHRAAAQSRGVTAEDISAAVAQSNALLPSGEFIAPTFDANVYTDAVPKQRQADRRRHGEAGRRPSGLHLGRGQGRGRRRRSDPDGLGQRSERGLPERVADPGREHPQDRRRSQKRSWPA